MNNICIYTYIRICLSVGQFKSLSLLFFSSFSFVLSHSHTSAALLIEAHIKLKTQIRTHAHAGHTIRKHTCTCIARIKLTFYKQKTIFVATF